MEELLAGPRARRFLAEIAESRLAPQEQWSIPAWWEPVMDRHSGDDLPSGLRGACLEQLQQLVARVDLRALAGVREPEELLEPLGACVDSARYWQDVDPVDGVLADPRAVEVLRPLAAAVLAAPATGWWRDDVDHQCQQHIDWPRGRGAERLGPGPVLSGGQQALREQREEAMARQAQERREHPGLGRAPWSGAWWSSPAHVDGVVVTSQVLEPPRSKEVLPVGLALVEDASDDGRAVVCPLRARTDARGPGDPQRPGVVRPRRGPPTRRHLVTRAQLAPVHRLGRLLGVAGLGVGGLAVGRGAPVRAGLPRALRAPAHHVDPRRAPR